MPKRIISLFLTFSLFLTLQPLSLFCDILSLDSLLAEAKQNNPEILAAKKRWEASIARAPQAKSLENPTVGIEFEKIPKGTLKLDRVMPDDRMLSISQMFPFFGKLPLKGKIALVESQMFAAEYKNTELKISNEVRKAYYDLFMNYKEIELTEANLEFLKNIAKVSEAKYTLNQMQQEELLKIYAEIAVLSNVIANLKQEQSAKNTQLNALLNRAPEAPLDKPDISEDISFKTDINLLYKLTLQNQPELLVFSYAVEKNKYAKSLAKKNFFPDFMPEVVLRRITAGGIGLWDLMLSLSVPLWFWTKQRYEVKEAIANLEEAQAAYAAMKNKLMSEVKGLAVKLEISKNKILLYKTSLIPLLENSIRSSLAAFRSGNLELMIILDSERMLIDTKMNYYKALVEYNMNLADLERTAGIDINEVKNENL